MKRTLSKKMSCVLGMLFLAVPAWSAIPSDLTPSEAGLMPEQAITGSGNPLLEQSEMILAKGGGNGGGGNGGGSGAGGGNGGNGGNGVDHVAAAVQEAATEPAAPMATAAMVGRAADLSMG